jgi:hypothetical protein
MALAEVIRKPKPGLSDLGGLARVFVYEVDQFRPDFEFPWRGDRYPNMHLWSYPFGNPYPNMTLLWTNTSLNIEWYNITLNNQYPVLLMKRLSDNKYMLASYEYAWRCLFLPIVAVNPFDSSDVANFLNALDLAQVLLELDLDYGYQVSNVLFVGDWQVAPPVNTPKALPSELSGRVIGVTGTLNHLYFKNAFWNGPYEMENAARIIFDVKEGEWKGTGNASNTQFSFLHGVMGKVAGYTKENNSAVDSYMGKDLMCVVQRPNGDMLLLGSTIKPLRMKISSGGGKAADDYVGSDIEFFQTDAIDFAPPILSSYIKQFVAGLVPAYV